MFFSLMELTLEIYESTSIITGPPRKHNSKSKCDTIFLVFKFYNFTCCYFGCLLVYMFYVAQINPPLSNDKVENFLTNRNVVFVVTFDEILFVYQ